MFNNHVMNKAFLDGFESLNPTDQHYAEKVAALAKLAEVATKEAELEIKRSELADLKAIKERELDNKQAELDLIGQRNEAEIEINKKSRILEYVKLGAGATLALLGVGYKVWRFRKTVQYEQDPEKPVFFSSNVGKDSVREKDEDIKIYKF